MAATVARLQAVLGADTRDFDRGIDRADKSVNRFGSSAKKGFGLAAKAAIGAGVVVGAGLAVGVKKSIDAASDLNESMNAVNVVFGKSSKIVTDFGEKAAKRTGLSMRQLNELVTPIGASLINTGFGADEAAKASVNLAKRAADMASVFNVDVSDALGAIQAGLRGEADPLERFGVGLNAAAVQAKAMKMGLADTTKELTAQDTAQARLALLMEQTNKVAGDFANTSDGVANSQRIMKAEMENATAQMGTALLPVAAKVTSAIAALIPKVLEFAQGLARRLRPAFELVVNWVRDHWPEIRRVAEQVFAAIGTAIQFLVQKTRQYWPQIQQIIQKVVDWFKTNLLPTIQSIVGNIREHWGTIEKVTRAVWGRLKGIILPLLEAVLAAVNTILAVFRGDWQTAWDNLKKIPIKILTALARGIKALGELFLVAAKALGKAVLDGLVAGVKSAPDLLASALKWVLDQAKEKAKEWFKIWSPSRVFADEIGKPISEGVAQGIIDSRHKIVDALIASLDEAVEKSRARVESRVGMLSSTLAMAFSKRLGAEATPAEKQLAAIAEARTQAGLSQAVKDAQRRLAEAQAGGDPRDILAAQQDLARAREDITINSLEKQAAIEREELEARQFFQQQKFDESLTALQNYLTSGEITQKQANKRIRSFMDRWGLQAQDMGNVLGQGWSVNYAIGIRQQIPSVVAAVRDLVESIRKRRVVGGKALKELQQFEQATLGRVAAGDRGPAPKVPGPGGGSTLDQLLAFAHSLGFNPSSGQTTGGTHTPGSLHYQGKAVDLSGSSSQMRNAFYAAIQTFGGRINELFYDPIGWYIDMGNRIRGAIGGHSDHVHLGLFDKGGFLQPGWNLAYNGLGRPEPVGAMPDRLYLDLGDLGVVELVRKGKQRFEKLNGPGSW